MKLNKVMEILNELDLDYSGACRTDEEWNTVLQTKFECTEQESGFIVLRFLGFSILRPAGDGKLYLDWVSVQNLKSFLNFIQR